MKFLMKHVCGLNLMGQCGAFLHFLQSCFLFAFQSEITLWKGSCTMRRGDFSLKSPWWGFYAVINFDLISKINVFRKSSYKEKCLKSISLRRISRWAIRLHFYATIPTFSFRNFFPESQKFSHFKDSLDFLKFSRKVMILLSLSWNFLGASLSMPII